MSDRLEAIQAASERNATREQQARSGDLNRFHGPHPGGPYPPCYLCGPADDGRWHGPPADFNLTYRGRDVWLCLDHFLSVPVFSNNYPINPLDVRLLRDSQESQSWRGFGEWGTARPAYLYPEPDGLWLPDSVREGA